MTMFMPGDWALTPEQSQMEEVMGSFILASPTLLARSLAVWGGREGM